MATFRDLAGDVYIRDFRILFGVPALSTDKHKVEIPFTGLANPALTANLTTYEYTLDGGLTWNTMSSSSTISRLSFTEIGAPFTFIWDSYTDISSDMYNNTIRVRLGATSGSFVTATPMYILYFEKISTDTRLSRTPPFPNDYRGIPGTDLMKNAPRATVSA